MDIIGQVVEMIQLLHIFFILLIQTIGQLAVQIIVSTVSLSAVCRSMENRAQRQHFDVRWLFKKCRRLRALCIA